MFDSQLFCFRPARLALVVCAVVLSACTVGPEMVKPTAAAPDDWTTWSSADPSLRASARPMQMPHGVWWKAFADPVLDRLQAQAMQASPDLKSASLRFAQARVQRSTVAAQRLPEVGLSGSATRQRQSETGAGTRLIDAIGTGSNADDLKKLLAEPFTLYQAGFDASWELDLWGRISRSVEAADADIAQQAALLELARQSLANDVARNYFELRTTQRQIRLARDDIAALDEQVEILSARVQGGGLDHLDLERQRAEQAALKAQLPALLAQESASANQLTLLLGERPGALHDQLLPIEDDRPSTMPDLTLGLSSEVALQRPDIRAAEAALASATADIGVAQAALYPSIRLGAKFGYESYLSGEFSDWGSRTWSIGPSLDLPLFDHGRRKSVVQLRELQQQEAAVTYQRTVLKAWQEIDDALSVYGAEQQQAQQLDLQVKSAGEAYSLAQARYQGGTIDFSSVLDSQRSYLQARRGLVASQGRLRTCFVTINKTIGNPLQPIGLGSEQAR
ncbi:efflux transporter outer membrane subunit [Pseudomonas sp.]|uniref:efflux transporter outer membrane subunit n=1 Tax=Pseudomonas sp. TaxID=306 RepID=UPI003BB71886